MCKLLIIPNVINQSKVQDFISAAQSEMTKYDNDGIGYAALTKDGIAIEKFLDTIEFGDWGAELPYYLNCVAPRMLKLSEALDDPSISSIRYESSGPINSTWQSIIVHSRFATNGKGIECTHPFKKSNTVLAHNGIVDSKVQDWLLNTDTECDTEVLLNGYIQSGIAYDTESIQSLSDNIEGYFAFGAYTEVDHGQYILDVVKDNTATLYCAWIEELKSEVYVTSQEIVDKAIEELGWQDVEFSLVQDCTLIRYFKNEVVEVIGFDRKEKHDYSKHYSQRKKIGTAYVYNDSGDLSELDTYQQLDELEADISTLQKNYQKEIDRLKLKEGEDLDEEFNNLVSDDPYIVNETIKKGAV